MEQEQTQNKKSKAGKIIKYAAIAVSLVILIVLANGFGMYQYNWQNSISSNLARYLPYPAALVNNQIVKLSDYQDNYQIVDFFNQSQILPSEGIEISENEIKADVLNKLILNQLVTQLAEKYGVRVGQSEIDYEIDNIKSHLTDGVSLDDRLETMYGIKQDKFVEKSLEPEILYVKLHEKYLSDESIDTEAKLANDDQEYRAQSILDRLKRGEDFSAVAKEFSDDEITKEYGGDLGFFGRGEMVPEFEEAAFGLEVGQISDVIKTDYGYHIVKTTDKKVLENDEEQVKASHILLKTADGYEDWISKNLKNSQIYVFVRGLKWEDGKVMIK